MNVPVFFITNKRMLTTDSTVESSLDVCVSFATQQPAPRGNLAVHCGGPGSLTDCNYSMLKYLDEEVRCESEHCLSFFNWMFRLTQNVLACKHDVTKYS